VNPYSERIFIAAEELQNGIGEEEQTKHYIFYTHDRLSNEMIKVKEEECHPNYLYLFEDLLFLTEEGINAIEFYDIYQKEPFVSQNIIVSGTIENPPTGIAIVTSDDFSHAFRPFSINLLLSVALSFILFII
jgi:hypothetical protein